MTARGSSCRSLIRLEDPSRTNASFEVRGSEPEVLETAWPKPGRPPLPGVLTGPERTRVRVVLSHDRAVSTCSLDTP